MLFGGLVGNAIAGPLGWAVGTACGGYICKPKKPVISPWLEHNVKAQQHSMHHYMPHQVDPSETQGFHYYGANKVCVGNLSSFVKAQLLVGNHDSDNNILSRRAHFCIRA